LVKGEEVDDEVAEIVSEFYDGIIADVE